MIKIILNITYFKLGRIILGLTMNVQPQLQTISREVANYFIPDKLSMYNLLTQQCGHFLPDFGSRCITNIYLDQVKNGEVWTLHYDKYKPMRLTKPLQLNTKTQLFSILKDLIPIGQSLGMQPPNLPDKKWLLDMIHSLNPKHSMFIGDNLIQEDAITRTVPKGCLFLVP